MRKVILLIVTALLIGCSSSVTEGQIEVIGGVQNVKVVEMSSTGAGINFEVMVKNSTGMKITVREADFDIEAAGRKIAIVKLVENVVLPRRSVEQLTIPVRVRMMPGSLIKIATMSDRDSLSISGRMVVRAGIIRKEIKVERIVALPEIKALLMMR